MFFCYFGCGHYETRCELMLHLGMAHKPRELYKWGLNPHLLQKFGLIEKYKSTKDFIEEIKLKAGPQGDLIDINFMPKKKWADLHKDLNALEAKQDQVDEL